MRILFLTSHFPYPTHSGGALRAFGLIKGAAEAGHEIHLFCFAENLPMDSPIHQRCTHIMHLPPPAHPFKKRLIDIVFTRHADMGRRFWSDEAAIQIQTYIHQHTFDIIHAESIEMAVYLIGIRQHYPNLRLIYGSLNAEADLQRTVFMTEIKNPRQFIGAVYSWIQWRRLTRLERQICTVSSHVLAVSEPDQALLQKFSDTAVTVVKNGIETATYLHIQHDNHLGAGTLVFTGSMNYRPNVDAVLWFAESVLPQIDQKVHFYVVGNHPHRRLSVLKNLPHITITGRVDDIIPYMAGATLYIAPLRMGSGTRFKLMEAMAAGCAIVSTTIGAQGLGVTSGQEMILADTAAEFSKAINTLLSQPDKRTQLAETGRAFVQAHFDWSVIIPHLLKVYGEDQNEQ